MTALAQCAEALTALTRTLGPGGPGRLPERAPSPVPVVEAVNEFMMAKARANRSDRYLRALRVSLCSFVRGRAQHSLGDVTVFDLEQWLDSHDWAPRTQRGYLSDVSVLFNWCIRRGLVKENPAAAVELPEDESRPPEIHWPGQVRAVLEFARKRDLNLCRCLAIRYFAGLRSSEADKLRDDDIRGEFIEVTARNAKTRRRRIVKVQPVLRAWLDLGGHLNFGDRGQRWRLFTAALKQRTGIEWPHNVTRHSFVSYHLAQFRNAADTALEAGHTEQMLFAHYREVVPADAAAVFWGLTPAA